MNTHTLYYEMDNDFTWFLYVFILMCHSFMSLPIKEWFCQSSLSLCPHADLNCLLEKMMQIGRAFLNHKYCCKSEKCPGLNLQRTTSLNLEVWGGLNWLSVVLVTSYRCKPISFYNKYLCPSCPLNLNLPNQNQHLQQNLITTSVREKCTINCWRCAQTEK